MTYIVILAVSLLLCAVGFWRYVYFFSVGYGFAVAGIGITLLILFHGIMTPVTWIACIVFIVYGVRLGGYLMIREMKSAAYNKILKPENDRSKSIAPGVKIAIWVSCAILYFLQTSPFTFRLENTANLIEEGAAMIAPDVAAAWIGLIMMILGVLLEIAADMQKNAAKKKNPSRFVDTGLYRIVRCPNYLGELVLWAGVFIAGIPYLQGALQWIIAILGLVGITYVMFSGARRLEMRQDRNYGDDPVYQKYVKTVPIMIPLIPLYSVKNWKAFVA
ncbi:MAG: DUF1295 domain-containing protein [Clostridiales bacterium]|nr:DUF1295 domain-containing protein [Clostridiales bacterium]MBE6046631.1 DUF1295 domain-containing protein [Clostridiales bacterium]